MSKWQTLLVKEIVHLFRDTKTIVQTVVVPTFITPLLIGAVIWYISSIAVDEGKKTYDVAVYDQTNTELTVKLLNVTSVALTAFMLVVPAITISPPIDVLFSTVNAEPERVPPTNALAETVVATLTLITLP